MQKRIEMDPQPKHGQVWKTKHGHLVQVLMSMKPGRREVIETAYVEGRVDGHLGANFHLDGHAVMSDDMLVEHVK